MSLGEVIRCGNDGGAQLAKLVCPDNKKRRYQRALSPNTAEDIARGYSAPEAQMPPRQLSQYPGCGIFSRYSGNKVERSVSIGSAVEVLSFSG